MKALHEKTCDAVSEDTKKIEGGDILAFSPELKLDWEVEGGKKIHHVFEFKDFDQAMEFVHAVADIANEQQHHPDIHIQYNKVTIELWTHVVDGLTENDFIVAAKIERI